MTYSIVARDPENGHLGVAVQSHFFGVRAVCPWVWSGFGAIATQAMAEISYGPLGLERLRSGATATDALAALVAADDDSATRQVAIVDANGVIAVHTGERCIAVAGHRSGDGWSMQANMMRGHGVPDAMADAFTAATGDLADRMLAALDAAEAAGGDVRGKQSAALVVGYADPAQPWERLIDVAVDDTSDPLGELRRLVRVRRAYLGDSSCADAMGDNPELLFWAGVAMAAAGQVDEAKPLLARAYAADPGWALLLDRLPAAGLFPDDPALLAALRPAKDARRRPRT
ncbi:MAG: DUF1028 domain-containing protein [Actinobacteria bacterium]|nr:DUF1028 domain-containing protein [Actinomycetota bacterium]